MMNMLKFSNEVSRTTAAKLLFLSILVSCGLYQPARADQSIARVWDERALAAIRVDTPHPPAQARNLFTFAVCMYDAWAAYDTNGAVGFVYRGKHTAPDIAAARNEAISYAVWRMMKERHVYSRTASNTLAADDIQMVIARLRYQQCLTRHIDTGGSRQFDLRRGIGLVHQRRRPPDQWHTLSTANPPVAYPDAPSSQGGYVYSMTRFQPQSRELSSKTSTIGSASRSSTPSIKMDSRKVQSRPIWARNG